ncbi:hypothetical protein [Streptomyces sp. NPDC019937]
MCAWAAAASAASRAASGREAADAPLYALHQQPVAFAHRRLPGLIL